MKFIVFGSTGRVGSFFVNFALKKGHTVTAWARDPSKIKITHEKLAIVKGDLNNHDDLVNGIKGHDVVIVAIGGEIEQNKKSTIITEGTKKITSAAIEAKVERYVAVSGMLLLPGKTHTYLSEEQPIMPLIRDVVVDHQGAADVILSHAKELDYTLICPPWVVDGDTTRLQENTPPPPHKPVYGPRKVTAGEVAAALLKVSEESLYHRGRVGIASDD